MLTLTTPEAQAIMDNLKVQPWEIAHPLISMIQNALKRTVRDTYAAKKEVPDGDISQPDEA